MADADSQASDTRSVVEHHIEALGAADLDTTLADYAGDAVLVSGGQVLRGHEALAAAFGPAIEGMFGPKESSFTLKTFAVDGEHAVITWGMKFPGGEVTFGTDTFVVRGGKIVFQSAGVVMG